MITIGTIVRSLHGKSPREVVQHAAGRLADWAGADALSFPLLPDDIADSAATHGSARTWQPTDSLRPHVAWVAFPPSSGSGGHTTMFRMMDSARTAGFDNTLVLYDRYGSDMRAHAATVRAAWPWLDCRITTLDGDLAEYDVVIASSWPTAHVVAQRRLRGQPGLYFIQDFEPYFYPRGSTYAFAEDSYRLGLRRVALGHMVAGCLTGELGLSSELVPFGCDAEVYSVLPGTVARRGIVFYAKQGNDRRGYQLAVQALRAFHRMRPDQPIHVYGDGARDLGIPVIRHGSVRPRELNELYNSVAAGLALSFTNISLVAEELLRAGVIPVINDSSLARADLDNPHVRWALPTPASLARELAAAVDDPPSPESAAEVSLSVRTRGWDYTGALLATIIREELGASRASSS